MALEFKPIERFHFNAVEGAGVSKQYDPLLKIGDNCYLYEFAAYIRNGVVTVEFLRAEEV